MIYGFCQHAVTSNRSPGEIFLFVFYNGGSLNDLSIQ